MPLTARKIAHVKAMIARVQQGRAQTVILTCRTPTGGTSTITTSAVWRVMGDFDPTLEGATNSLTHVGAEPDINAIFDAAQITLAQLRSCLYAELADPTGQPAERYVLLDVEPIGMLPGGDRFFTKWSRQH